MPDSGPQGSGGPMSESPEPRTPAAPRGHNRSGDNRTGRRLLPAARPAGALGGRGGGPGSRLQAGRQTAHPPPRRLRRGNRPRLVPDQQAGGSRTVSRPGAGQRADPAATTARGVRDAARETHSNPCRPAADSSHAAVADAALAAAVAGGTRARACPSIHAQKARNRGREHRRLRTAPLRRRDAAGARRTAARRDPPCRPVAAQPGGDFPALHAAPARRGGAGSRPPAPGPKHLQGSPFASLAGGMERLVAALMAELGAP